MTIAIGTALLMLPIAKAGPGGATLLEALFTATSAVCVTGLTVVDTATYWTPLGQVIIMLLIQLGGLGIMIFAALIGLVLARKMSVRARLNTATEAKAVGFDDVRGLVRGIFADLAHRRSRDVRAAVPAIPVGLRLRRRARPPGSRRSTRSPRSTTPGSPSTPTT